MARRTLEDVCRENAFAEFIPKSLDVRHGHQGKAFEEAAKVPLEGPFSKFSADYLPQEILSVIRNKGYSVPTPVQAQAWPILLQGRDLLCTAPTGSGKTLAYLVPAIIKTMNLSSKDGPSALILSPTRELAEQIFTYAQSFEMNTGVHSYCVYGGVPKPPQIKHIMYGGGICIATPGRMNDFLRTQVVSLRNCSYIVLDEADVMLEFGFLRQIQSIINQIAFNTQIVMFSATWKEAYNFLKENVGREYIVMKIGPSDLVIAKKICQIVEVCQESCKWTRLLEVLNEIGKNDDRKVLIFTNTKRNVEFMTHSLRSLGWYVIGLHSEKLQEDRSSALSSFRFGLIQILVTTDVVSRGLVIHDVKYVVNFDFPLSFGDYIHRSGRTGQNDKSGTVYTLFTYENRRHARNLINILETSGQHVPPEICSFANNYEFPLKKFECRRSNNLFRFRSRRRLATRPYDESSKKRRP